MDLTALSPESGPEGDRFSHAHPGRHWRALTSGAVECMVCPRRCKMHHGQRGLCYVRGAWDGEVVLTTYGRSSGFCIDPIEKKPLNHFLPGTPILSFGTAGCNLTCTFCQNWEISKARAWDRLNAEAEPERIAEAALRHGCRSVAFTYNDPVIFLEYAADTALACHERGLKTVAVTAGYVEPDARVDFFRHIDAANVDLKGFSEDFYRKRCTGALAPVLDTLRYLAHDTDIWLEITTLLIPTLNDGDDEVKALADWVAETLGPDVPLHLSAFHPDHKMRDLPRTPASTLTRARRIAREAGLHHVYLGNVHDPEGSSTYCAGCGHRVIERDWYALGAWGLDHQGLCQSCGTRLPGVFEAAPGTWGRRRAPIHLA
ncbi:AmmeMemoRadiSam system radical SAM enzyme [Roseospira visakhapatnamensis]|uniref:Pyruvate formate lyase activating enzyme n=1 Tax=Roseospira visakhapatnamensis TaxID=390880 RepID=A0A7W6RBW8_9PROT|nr:AmmeMemoRadiSam system radical SAM enzyme [Roseospira visakhapatnamensis]MBB4265542.1 pyruvate formate lyase activating enzyme [Roseospira visakhapatnamensis]